MGKITGLFGGVALLGCCFGLCAGMCKPKKRRESLNERGERGQGVAMPRDVQMSVTRNPVQDGAGGGYA